MVRRAVRFCMCLFKPIIRGDDDSTSLYLLLDVARDADAGQIRAAFRRSSLRLHPDKIAQRGRSPTPHDRAAFQRLVGAYHTLSDARRRAIYDEYGENAVLWSEQPSGVDPHALA